MTGEDEELLRARLASAEERNARLRRELGDIHHSRYRNAARGLVATGLIALGAAVLLPEARDILIAVGGIGVFSGILIRYTSPGRFLSFSVFEAVSSDLLWNEERMVSELGLRNEAIYVPVSGPAGGVRLFVPGDAQQDVPDSESLRDIFVVSSDGARGLSLRPSGIGMYDEFVRSFSGSVPDDPAELCEALCGALSDQFELVTHYRVDVDVGDSRADVGLTLEGDLSRFDHPVTSFLGTGLAAELGEEVSVEILPDRGGFDALLIFSWR